MVHLRLSIPCVGLELASRFLLVTLAGARI